ncbi:MAG: GNAT family N-acetyltransferase [Pseudomonadales bacterium]
MKIHSIKTVTPEDLEVIRDLARKIWFEHYPGIITNQQINYMLDRGYTIDTLRNDLVQGITMTILMVEAEPAGFAAFGPAPKETGTTNGTCAKLHKLYLASSFQRHGFGSVLLQDAEAKCHDSGYSCLTLSVNKHNAIAVAFYKRHGYQIIASVLDAIGGGFFMDDYLMGRHIGWQIGH